MERETFMRKIVISTFVTLDGIMQAPGEPHEDMSGSFNYGGWSVPYWDKDLEIEMSRELMQPFDLLIGRTTYDIFRENWPKLDPESVVNKTTKYVVSGQPLPEDDNIWQNTIQIKGNPVTQIKALINESGNDLQVHGSSKLIQLLLQNNLADELWLKIYPITLVKGKRLFGEGTIPKRFVLTESHVTSKGVIIVKYQRLGDITTGAF